MYKNYDYRQTFNDCWEVFSTHTEDDGEEYEEWVATCETETIAIRLIGAMEQ